MTKDEFDEYLAGHLSRCRDDLGSKVEIFPRHLNRRLVGRIAVEVAQAGRQGDPVLWRAILKLADERRRQGVSQVVLASDINRFVTAIKAQVRVELDRIEARRAQLRAARTAKRGPGPGTAA